MSFHTVEAKIAAKAYCDKPGCNAETSFSFYQLGPGASLTLGIILGERRERSDYETERIAAAVDGFKLDGWTFWVGARTSYAYCQDHKPTATSRSTTEIDGQRIASPCFYGKHETCDTVMKVSQYRKYRACECGCHKETTDA